MENNYPIHIGPVLPCSYCQNAFINEHFLMKHIHKCHQNQFLCLVKQKLNIKKFSNPAAVSINKNLNEEEIILIDESSSSSASKPSSPSPSSALQPSPKIHHDPLLSIEDILPGVNNISSETHCSICNSQFESNSLLIKHLISHLTESFESSVKTHLNQYGNYIKKHIKCLICLKSFSQNSNLNKHLKLHFGLYYCKFCPKTYSQIHNYLIHLESHNTDSQYDNILQTKDSDNRNKIIFSCKICEEPKQSAEEIIYHLKMTHSKLQINNSGTQQLPETIKCMICNKNFKSLNHYKSHIKLHFKFSTMTLFKKFINSLHKNITTSINSKKLNDPNKVKVTDTDKVNNDDIRNTNKTSDNTKSKNMIKNIIKEDSNHGNEINIKDNQERLLKLRKSKMIQCAFCNLKCKNNGLYQIHLKKRHKKKKSELIITSVSTIAPNSSTFSTFYPSTTENNYLDGEDKTLFCKICKRTFGNLTLYSRHFLLFHDVTTSFLCKECNIRYLSKFKYFQHIKLFHKNKNFQCQLCGKYFAKLEILNQHSMSHMQQQQSSNNTSKELDMSEYPTLSSTTTTTTTTTIIESKPLSLDDDNNGKFKCPVCNEIFQQKRKYLYHFIMHSSEFVNSFPCPFCMRICDSNYNLLAHIRIHDDKDQKLFYYFLNKKKNNIIQHKCLHCKRSFNNDDALQTHLLFYHKIKKNQTSIKAKAIVKNKSNLEDEKDNYFKCDECNRHFLRKSDLSKHVQQHRIKIYTCSICQKTFKTEDELNEHCFTHKKIFSCTFCIKEFNDKIQFNDHILLHAENKLSVCTLCKQSFSRKTDLIKHEQLVHDIKKDLNISTLECYLCKNTFKSQIELKQHKADYHDIYECSKCKQIFLENELFKDHLLAHEIDDDNESKIYLYECNKCCEKFNDKTLLINHLNKLHNYPCNLCNKIFTCKNDLMKHKDESHEIYECEICLKQFEQQSLYEKHKLIHQSTKTLCDNIEVPLDNKNECKDNRQKKDINKLNLICSDIFQDLNIIECPLCNWQLDNEEDLFRHQIQHHAQCDLCKMWFQGNKQLKQHSCKQKQNTNKANDMNKQTRFESEIWNPKFTQKDDYLNHNQQQMESQLPEQHEPILLDDDDEMTICVDKEDNPKEYHCKQCNKQFPSENDLTNHKAIEHDVHQCDICNTEFFIKENLDAHMLTHLSSINPVDTNFKCEICNRLFGKKRYLNLHKKICQTKLKQMSNGKRINFNKYYSCGICKLGFSKYRVLEKHLQSSMDPEHQNYYRIQLNNPSMSLKESVIQFPQQTETITSSSISQSLSIKPTSSLASTSLKETSSPFVLCTVCKKTFISQDELEVHTSFSACSDFI